MRTWPPWDAESADVCDLVLRAAADAEQLAATAGGGTRIEFPAAAAGSALLEVDRRRVRAGAAQPPRQCGRAR